MHDVSILLVDGPNLLWRGAFEFPAPIYSRGEDARVRLLRTTARAIGEEFTTVPTPAEVIDKLRLW